MSQYFPKPHGGFGKNIMVKLYFTVVNYAKKSALKSSSYLHIICNKSWFNLLKTRHR